MPPDYDEPPLRKWSLIFWITLGLCVFGLGIASIVVGLTGPPMSDWNPSNHDPDKASSNEVLTVIGTVFMFGSSIALLGAFSAIKGSREYWKW